MIAGITHFFSHRSCLLQILRATLFTVVVTDIRNANKAKKQPKFNRQLQTFIRRQIEGDCPMVARKALDTIVELYRRLESLHCALTHSLTRSLAHARHPHSNATCCVHDLVLLCRRVWNDTNTVNIVAQACLSDFAKISVGGIRFFLGINREMVQIEEEEEEARKEGGAADAANQVTREQASRMHQHSKPTRKRMRRKAKALAQVKKRNTANRTSQVLFPAIEVLHDPNGFVDKLFRKLKKRQDVFATRLMIMDLLSRVIGMHKLVVPAFYSYVQRFLTAYQKDVSRILAVLLQSCHPFTPAEDLYPLVRTIANNFIRDKCPGPVIATGINSISGLFQRSEHILEEMQQEIEPLVKELAEFKKFKDKGVIIAARGFINTIREKFPALLPRRDRGKDSDKQAKPKQYGQVGKKGSVQEDEAAAAAEAEANQSGSEGEEMPPQKRTRSDTAEGGEGSDSEGGSMGGWAEFEGDSDESEEDEGVDLADAVVVDPSIIEGYSAKKKLSREQRILNAAAGGNDYGKTKGGGSTNKEKSRRKNFGMIKHSQAVRDKLRKSYKDQVKSIKKRMAALQRQGNKRVKRGRR